MRGGEYARYIEFNLASPNVRYELSSQDAMRVSAQELIPTI